MSAVIEGIDKDALRPENPASEFIPYRAQIDDYTIKCQSGDFVRIIKLEGVAHEAASIDDIENWKEQLNSLLKNIASPNLCLWTNTVRREIKQYPKGLFNHPFDRKLNDKYRGSIQKTKTFVNELYLSIVFRPENSRVVGLFSKFETNIENLKEQQKEHLQDFDDITSYVQSALAVYRPRMLEIYERNNRLCSEPLEFLDYLINGYWTPRYLQRKPVNEVLARSRVFFGMEAFEIRSVADRKFGATLGILEYPEETDAGLINSLLSAPFQFVLTQSFGFISRPVAVKTLQRQQRTMIQDGDLAESQIAAISDALDDVVSGRIVFGHHHLNLSVYADTTEQLRKNLSAAQAELADSGLVVAREDLSLSAAFWSQLPGNTQYRPRPALISSRNFAGFSSFHNYPIGEIDGNQWGPAVTSFKTSSGAPYFFNFHEPLDSYKRAIKREGIEDEEQENKSGQKALGNTLIIGPSGTGKTVVQGFLMSQSQKFDPTQVVFDKDRGLEIFIRAKGGVYLPLLTGKKTGFNPFQIDPTADNLNFLVSLVKKLCGGTLSTKEEREIENAVNGVMKLSKESRRLRAILEFLDPVSETSPYERLQKWCYEGTLAWVFDNEIDELSFSGNKNFGFDVTDFIDNDEIRTPVIMYLFHRVNELVNGEPLQIFLDEFWKLLLDEYFEDFALNKQKVIRKQNGIMVYGTQSASDVLKSKIAPALIEQCATFIFMPNPKAREEDYINGFHLTEREFELIKRELLPNSRKFLIKKGHESVVAELNLKGFDDELAIISGTTDNVLLVSEIIEEVGSNPDKWVPIFHERRKK
ncbi:VirB4 family type IV secretion/conjugal transfer ATPase [sulfur-oxidizing endosymbiont of Gigantopelta aegis]|uniref:VirB4 family type IV secretion/conjugal transfer ATPase n=1 Tax=sulfur-oxidizing endosymbiont of Gigantopelta aegis TaxID=2794934 RepID=UPI0018DB2B85|nr:VirB4 family type IV secretion/conjugal transfer ATPase [sulfur-oxidizing endosymbiont of Gigantopelta aegis]